MFYSQVILARKGPLGKIWLAAHFEKRLSKAQIFSTDIVQSVDNVLNPSTPLALRVSGHLMLGIVRIYSKKVKYLMVDCTEAMWKMKIGFKPGKVDIDTTATHAAIDDHRHYGHVAESTAMVDLPVVLENVGFSSQMLPSLSISRLGYLDDESVLTEMSDASRLLRAGRGAPPFLRADTSPLSEIEEMRAGTPRSSLGVIGRSPLSFQGGRTSYLSRFDEELPAFEEEIEMVVPQAPPFSPMALLPVREEVEAEAMETTEEEEISEREEVPAKAIAKMKAKVHFDDRVELSDKHLRETIVNTSAHLRRRPDDPLALHKVSARDFQLSPEFFSRDLANELVEVMDLAMGIHEMPFPPSKPHEEEEFVSKTVRERPVEVSPLASIPEEIRGRKRLSRMTPEMGRVSYEPTFEMETPFVEGIPAFETPEVLFPPSVVAVPGLRKRKDIEKVLSRPTVQETVGEGAEPLLGNRRSREVLALIRAELAAKKIVTTESMFSECSRETVGRGFLELLQLKCWNMIELRQDESFGNIEVTLPAKS